MQTRRILLGALAAPVLLLPACGGHDSVADPRVASAPTSSDSTDPPKRESPEHFIRRWFHVGTRMQNTGETADYRAMQHGCRGCTAVATRVERTYARGGYFHTRGLSSLKVLSDHKQGRQEVIDLRVVLYPTSYRGSAHQPRRHFHGGPAHFQVALSRRDSTWVVASFVQVAT
jgi:hypothetical protein